MTIQFDDKGKFFTDVINKEAIPVIIQTITNRIQGLVYTRPGFRLKDMINETEKFIAITDANIYDTSGKIAFQCGFMTINREHIVWMFPTSEITQGVSRDDKVTS
jgi:hypothetical protein